MNGLNVVVLTQDEEDNIGACLESVRDLCPVFVVDSGSTDKTLEICQRYTDKIVHHSYENHATQWQWAFDHLPLDGDWVLALDADFVVTPELRSRLVKDLKTLPPRIAGVYVKHTYYFGGGPIRFGGIKHHWLRVVRRGRARVDPSDLVDFRFIVDGDTVRWNEAVLEHNIKDDDLSFWLAKQDKFAARLAIEEQLRRRKLLDWNIEPRLRGNPDQKAAWLRDLWLHLPLFVRPALYFIYRYVLALGFLDGRAGFLYHSLQGYLLRVMVDWKLVELRRHSLSDQQLLNLRHVMTQTRSGSITELIDRMQGSGMEERAGSDTSSPDKRVAGGKR